jgi:signal transduction histidine kinase
MSGGASTPPREGDAARAGLPDVAPPGPGKGGGNALRDASMALPVALLLLLVLTSFTVLSYRNGTRALRAEALTEAAAAAQRAAEAVGRSGLPSAGRLVDFHPAAVRLVLGDGAGNVLGQVGEPLAGRFLSPLGGAVPDRPTAAGPGEAIPDGVAGYAPLRGGRPRFVRIDLATPTLARQLRTASLLSWITLSASAAVLLWILLFLRQLLRPYEALLAMARDLGGAAERDEAAFLLATVERALAPRQDAREELAVLERTLAPSVESGLLLLDREGRVLALNPTGAALLGPAPPPRTPLAELLAAQPALLSLLDAAVRSGQGAQRQECALVADGVERRVGLTATPLRRAGGSLLGFLVLFTDLTADERLDRGARLAESLAQLGELSAGVAHELRNGLATLSGYVTLLERSPPADAAAEYLAELRLETANLQRVVTDFLSFARPETARPQALDLGQVVRQAVADPALEAAAVHVVVEDSRRAARLTGDAQLLVRALRNLLRNALEAQERNGTEAPVEVAAAWAGEDYEVTIADRGAGLGPEMRRRLFQPFASDRTGGVGLGLALSHRIVGMHGGRLALEDRPGGGTVARLTFPAASLVAEGATGTAADGAVDGS